jgi:hypothetical protein
MTTTAATLAFSFRIQETSAIVSRRQCVPVTARLLSKGKMRLPIAVICVCAHGSDQMAQSVRSYIYIDRTNSDLLPKMMSKQC